MSKYPTQEQIGVLLKCCYLGKYTLAAEIMSKTPSQIKTIEENALRSIRLAYSKSYMQGKKFEGETVLCDMAERSGLSLKELTGIFDAYITGGLASEDRVFWERVRCKGGKPTAAELLDFIVNKVEKWLKMCYNKRMSYDIKFRHRAIEYWNDGHSKRATAEVFKVSATTLQKWKSQLKETGNLEPKKRRETWRKIEPVKLKEYLKQHPDAYLKEIAEEFGCSDVAVQQAFRRLKISRKKNYHLQRN